MKTLLLVLAALPAFAQQSVPWRASVTASVNAAASYSITGTVATSANALLSLGPTGLPNGVVTAHIPAGCSFTPFTSNTCRTFQNSDGSYSVDYLGNISGQKYSSSLEYVSASDLCGTFGFAACESNRAGTPSAATTYAFTGRTGNFVIWGNGDIQGQIITGTTVTTNTVYNVGSTPGVTGATCTAWTGGICSHL